MERTIFHSDINNCYATVECLYDETLRGKPVAVGGDERARHGIVLAKSEEAKVYGVRTGETLWQARQKCPELIVVQPHFDRYLDISRRIRRLFYDYTDRIEPFGLDEAWLDVSGSLGLVKRGGGALARELADRVKRELGVTVSVGVSDNKVFAKLGSDLRKPDGVTVITRENYRACIWPLSVRELLYVGRATARKLEACGITTIGRLAAADPANLRSLLGKMGEVLYGYANGLDAAPVALLDEAPPVKSIGNSTTLPRDLETEEDVRIVFSMLAEEVARRLRESGFLAGTVQISVRDNTLSWFERQERLLRPSDLTGELCGAAMRLFRRSYDWPRGIRSLGLRACELVPAHGAVQTDLFQSEEKRLRAEAVERTMDGLRARYGKHCITRAITRLDTSLSTRGLREESTLSDVAFCGVRGQK